MTTQTQDLGALLSEAAQRFAGVRTTGIGKATFDLAANVKLTLEIKPRTLEDALQDAAKIVVSKAADEAVQAILPSLGHVGGLARQPKKRDRRQQALDTLSTSNFSTHYVPRFRGFRVEVVGGRFQDRDAQRTLDSKSSLNKILLVRQPDNEVDANAIMALAWDTRDNAWRHVGFVPALTAKFLAAEWPDQDKLVLLAEVDEVLGKADAKGPHLRLRLTGETRDYPGFRRAA